MTDDHDSCEWVNVSSGTGSLGCPRESPESHKTFVCVYVCVLCNSELDDLMLLILLCCRKVVVLWSMLHMPYSCSESV